MQAVTITQINFEDLRVLIDKSIDKSIREALNNIPTTTGTIPLDKPYSVDEAAEYLGIAVPTVYTKTSRNELPDMKRGGRIYFWKSELDKYLNAGGKKTAEEIRAEALEHIANNKKSLNNG